MDQQDRLKLVGAALLRLNYGLPQTPGLTEKNVETYAIVLRDIPAEAITEAILRILETWEYPRTLPTPGQIRHQALMFMAEQQGLPDAVSAWREAITAISRQGVRNAKFSHSAITDAVEAMGGISRLATSDNMVADRAHWINSVYPQILRQHLRIVAEHAADLEAGEQPASLMAGSEHD
jgi:hypothetical protein